MKGLWLYRLRINGGDILCFKISTQGVVLSLRVPVEEFVEEARANEKRGVRFGWNRKRCPMFVCCHRPKS